MKHLKMSIYLLLAAAIFTSCEKETTANPENLELNAQRPKSMLEILKSGADVETYFNSLPKLENNVSKQVTSQRSENATLQFFYNPDDLTCYGLPTEDFEKVNHNYELFPNYLDKNTDNYWFSPGDILPGISFELKRTYDYNWEDYYGDGVDNIIDDGGWYIWGSQMRQNNNLLMSDYPFTDLVINFLANNVNSVSMQVIDYSSTNMNVDIYGATGNLIGTDVVYVSGFRKTFFGVESKEPISKIILKSQYMWGSEGLDNVSFGFCDFDGDGCLEGDAHPYSDLSEKINITGCYPNVNNKLVNCGTTMMDQIKDLTAQINSEYNGQNYKTLHSKFMTKLAQITYNWRTARLITTTQRSQISSCAWGARIPYYNYN